MATKCYFVKRPGGYLEPVGEESEQYIAGIKVGAGLSFEVTKAHNVKFHRKAFKLLRIAFEAWEPDTRMRLDGLVPMKNFSSFREDILILAGHCDAFYRLDGSVHFVARSISFAKCKEIEFELVYKRILDVVWERLLQHTAYASQEELDDVVSTLMSFT